MRDPAANDPISGTEAEQLFAARSGEPVLVLAVSGGPDSTALMWLAARWRDGLRRPPKLVAVTIDHGLRSESACEALAVKKLAKKLNVEHRTVCWIGNKPRSRIQEAARNARYRLLAEAAHRVGAEYILTAHTLDDQAETVLFRLTRASGLTGLRGMTQESPLSSSLAGKRKLYLFRPMLRVAKSRLIATLAAAEVPFIDDPSNRDPRFTRPRLRALMPALAAEGLTAQRLALLAERVTRAEIALCDVLNQALTRLAPGPWPDKGPVAVDFAALADLSREIALRLLGRIIERVGNEGPVELGKLEALCDALELPVRGPVMTPRGSGRLRRTLAGAMITRSGTKLTIEQAPSRRTGTKSRKSAPKPLSSKSPFTNVR